VLTCADANERGEHLVWSEWSSKGASASGVLTWNICRPDCAGSKTWGTAPARFTLGKLTDAKAGWLFESLAVRIVGKLHGFQRVQTFPEAPVSP
jgi:hypothetical protein